MSTVGAELSTNSFGVGTSWEEPHAHGHSVQFYEDDTFLLDGLSRFIGAAVVAGDSAIVIATKAHRDGLTHRLTRRGLDLTPAIQQGRFISLDAAETLSKFMVKGWPDAERFSLLVGNIMVQLTAASQGEHRRVAAFGEMVALLWADGKPDAAIRLEQLWNDLSQTHAFQLHCAYPIRFFTQEQDGGLVQKICSEHSHVVPTEDYTTLVGDEERRRSIIFLQQKAQALETEILERKKAQQALQNREAELSDFLENALIGMHWVAGDGTILWANKAEMDLLGYSREEYIGHHIRQFHADQNVINDILERLTRNEELHGYQARLRCKDGSIRHVRIHSNVYMQDGKFNHTRCFTTDITEQERSERRIASQHAVTRLLAEASSFVDVTESILETICGVSECDMSAVWMVDQQTQELRCVKTWRRSNGDFMEFEKLTVSTHFAKGVGLPGRIWEVNQPAWIPDLATDDNLPRLLVALKEHLRSAFGFPIITRGITVGVIEFFARQVRQPDGEFLNMMSAIGLQIGQFIERKQAEEALHISEKLASVGRMAATVAHEINNPLEAVTNFIYLAKQSPDLPEKLKRYLDRADKELGRVSHIAQQTLGFYRDSSQPVHMVVSNVVEDVLGLYENKFKYKDLTIERRIQPNLRVYALQGEWKQILSNLLANAIDASRQGGKILISARASHHFQSGRHGVRLTVADQGTGISRESQRKLFTPFFTTKKEVGTGLGLWITKDLVEKKGGHIRFRSRTQVKAGTAMSIFVPLERPAASQSGSPQ